MEGAETGSKKNSKSFSIESLIKKSPTKTKKIPKLEIVNVTEVEEEENKCERNLNIHECGESFLTSTPQFGSRSFGLQDRLSPDVARSPSPIGSDDGDKENKMALLTAGSQKRQYSSPNTSNGSENSECDTSGSRRKKARTAFSSEQLCELERRFRLHKYLGTDERNRLAQELGLVDQQVKTWFQNRRMKEKRQIREMEQLQTIPMSSQMMSTEPACYPFTAYSPSTPVSSIPASSLPGFSVLPPGFMPRTSPLPPGFLPKTSPLSFTSGLVTSVGPMGHFSPAGSPFAIGLQHSASQVFPVRPMLQ